MREFVEDGTVKAFALWNPGDLGYLAAYAANALVDGRHHRRGGRHLRGRRPGRVHRRRRRRRRCSATRSCSTRTTSATSTSESRRPTLPAGPAPAGQACQHRAQPVSITHPEGAVVQRVCFQLQVRRDRMAEYRERHAAVWPEMLGALHETRMAQLLPVPARRRPADRVLRDPRPDRRPGGMAATEVNARWQAEMAEFFEELDGRPRTRASCPRRDLPPRGPAGNSARPATEEN